MNDEQFEDIKELVQVSANNTEANLKKEFTEIAAKTEANIRGDMKKMEIRLTTRMDDGFAGVGDAFLDLSDHIDEKFGRDESKLANHERRITKLERAI